MATSCAACLRKVPSDYLMCDKRRGNRTVCRDCGRQGISNKLGVVVFDGHDPARCQRCRLQIVAGQRAVTPGTEGWQHLECADLTPYLALERAMERDATTCQHQFAGACPACRQSVEKGADIRGTWAGWVHAGCLVPPLEKVVGDFAALRKHERLLNRVAAALDLGTTCSLHGYPNFWILRRLVVAAEALHKVCAVARVDCARVAAATHAPAGSAEQARQAERAAEELNTQPRGAAQHGRPAPPPSQPRDPVRAAHGGQVRTYQRGSSHQPLAGAKRNPQRSGNETRRGTGRPQGERRPSQVDRKVGERARGGDTSRAAQGGRDSRQGDNKPATANEKHQRDQLAAAGKHQKHEAGLRHHDTGRAGTAQRVKDETERLPSRPTKVEVGRPAATHKAPPSQPGQATRQQQQPRGDSARHQESERSPPRRADGIQRLLLPKCRLDKAPTASTAKAPAANTPPRQATRSSQVGGAGRSQERSTNPGDVQVSRKRPAVELEEADRTPSWHSSKRQVPCRTDSGQSSWPHAHRGRHYSQKHRHS